MDALATRMNEFQQEMDTIQRQLDFQEEISPSIDRMTKPSIDIQQATSEVRHTSIDSKLSTSIDDKYTSPFTSMKDEILSSIKMDNKWEQENIKKKLDVFYCTLDNNLNWATKRGELLQKELDVLRKRKSIDRSISHRSIQSIQHRSI